MIDRTIARHHGVDIVTRPTGGGAILHTDELTYCVTLPLQGRKPSAVYNLITSALLSGLHTLGLRAAAERWSSSFSPDGPYEPDQLCFSGVARNEVCVGGRKLIGSAQRIYRTPAGDRVILQHGSILLSDAHTLLPVYLKHRSPGKTAQNIRDLQKRSTSLYEVLGNIPDIGAIMEAFQRGFEDTPALWAIPAAQKNIHPEEVIA